MEKHRLHQEVYRLCGKRLFILEYSIGHHHLHAVLARITDSGKPAALLCVLTGETYKQHPSPKSQKLNGGVTAINFVHCVGIDNKL